MWHRRQEVSAMPACGPSIASVMSAWHVRHACSATARLRGLIRSGSGKSPVVKANECQNPLEAFVRYFAANPGGVWQSLQAAAARWLDLSQASKCSLMMWQFAQAAGSLVRYD